jgi:hypothetical protein
MTEPELDSRLESGRNERGQFRSGFSGNPSGTT